MFNTLDCLPMKKRVLEERVGDKKASFKQAIMHGLWTGAYRLVIMVHKSRNTNQAHFALLCFICYSLIQEILNFLIYSMPFCMSSVKSSLF